MKNQRINSKKAAFGGILAALVIIALYAEAVSPVNKLSLYALSSLAIAVIVMETGVRNGWIFYIATTALAFLVVPDKVAVIPYAAFFGLYGLYKYYIEKLGKLIPEYILKLLYFNAFAILSFILINKYVIGMVNLKLPWWGLALLFNAVFLVYDYVYSLFTGYYVRRIRQALKL